MLKHSRCVYFLKDQTRIIVFVGKVAMLRKYMDQMRIEQLFSDGKYMLIYLDPKTILQKELAYFLSVRTRAIIVSRPMFLQNYSS